MRKLLFCAATLILLVSGAFAFNTLGLDMYDARGLAMAGAITALGDDGNAASENPAGLGVLEQGVVSVSGMPMFGLEGAGVYRIVANGALPLGPLGTPGFAINYFDVRIDGDALIYSLDAVLSYGYNLDAIIPGLSVGAGASFQMWNLDSQWTQQDEALPSDGINEITPNLTLGARYQILEPLAVGLSFANVLGLEMEHGGAVSREVRLGVAYRLEELLITAKGRTSIQGTEAVDVDIAAGAEYVLFEVLAVRAGAELLSLDVQSVNLYVGGGYTLGSLSINIGAKYIMSYGSPSTSFSIAYRFGESADE